jgi:two-component sensor histidine kinase
LTACRARKGGMGIIRPGSTGMSPKIEECSRPNEVRSVSPERDGSAATSSAEAQLRVALAENTRLALALQTMRHSVGNQLALLSAMLARQARAGGEPAIQHALKAAQRRVHVVAETLRLEGHGEDGELVGSKLLVERTAEGLSELAARAEIKIEVDVQDVALQRDEAVSFMLTINELVVNSLRHAFPYNMTGEILVRLTHASDAAGEVLALIVEDNGVGRSADDKMLGLARRSYWQRCKVSAPNWSKSGAWRPTAGEASGRRS